MDLYGHRPRPTLGTRFRRSISAIIPLGLGLVIAFGGFIFGLTSHQVSFSLVPHISIKPYFIQGGTDYFQQEGTSTYYILNEKNLAPSFQRANFFKDGASFDIVASSESHSLNEVLDDGARIQGDGYPIEQITFYDANGQITSLYATSDYIQHPNGYFIDHWFWGRLLIYAGIAIAALSLLVGIALLFRRIM